MDNRQVRDNSGVLFSNDKKDNERAPHYKGNITVEGKDYWFRFRRLKALLVYETESGCCATGGSRWMQHRRSD